MRTVITGSGLIVTLIICILIHSSIVSANIRDNEVNAGLNQAMDYAVDVMGDIYTDLSYQPENNDAYIEALMNAFCDAVRKRIGTDGEVSVALLSNDIETGQFNIAVKEEYSYPVKGKKGICYCEKAFAFR